MFKKMLLITTSMMVLAPGLAAAVITFDSADGKYTSAIGGSMTADYGILSQKKLFEYATAGDQTSDKLSINGKGSVTGELIFDLSAKASETSRYGIFIDLNANNSPSMCGRTDVSDRLMIYAQDNNMGRFEMGSYDGLTKRIQVTPSNYAVDTGGPDGDYSDWYKQGAFQYLVNVGTGVPQYVDASKMFYTSIKLPGSGYESRANKVTYYSPAFNGFSAGTSFTPDTDSYGTIFRSTGDTAPVRKTGFGYKNVFGLGARYDGKAGIVEYALSIMGETGQAKTGKYSENLVAGINSDMKRHDLMAYEVGASATVKGFTLSTAYANLGKSGSMRVDNNILTDGKKPSTQYYSAGAAYTYDKFSISATYYHSDTLGAFSTVKASNNNQFNILSHLDLEGKKNKFNMYAIGVNYKLFENLTAFAEYNYFKYAKSDGANHVKAYDEKAIAADGQFHLNKGSVALIGLKAKF